MENFIPVVTRSYSIKVKTENIIMLERESRRLRILTEEGEYVFYGRLQDVVPLLSKTFYPCLKGCYINFDKVDAMKDQTIIFENGFKYEIGRNNYIKTRQNYSQYIKKLGRFSE